MCRYLALRAFSAAFGRNGRIEKDLDQNEYVWHHVCIEDGALGVAILVKYQYAVCVCFGVDGLH